VVEKIGKIVDYIVKEGKFDKTANVCLRGVNFINVSDFSSVVGWLWNHFEKWNFFSLFC